MDGSKMDGSKMDGSKLDGSQMDVSQMDGSQMDGSHLHVIEDKMCRCFRKSLLTYVAFLSSVAKLVFMLL